MPELPEVETVMRGLEPHLTGQKLVVSQARRPDLRFPIPVDFQQITQGQTVTKLQRRAKYLLWHLSNDQTLILHLGMSGRVLIDSEDTLGKHDHLLWETNNNTEIRYQDPRRFGFVDLVATTDLLIHKSFAALGPEPLNEGFSPEFLAEKKKGRSVAIKQALLDQKMVAGLGNIYVCEALYRAKVHPTTPFKALNNTMCEILVGHIKDVLSEAIAAGGSSLQDHRQVDGSLGYFQHAWKVYGREGEPCQACEARIERIQQAGRSSFFCPDCQLLA